VIRDEPERKVVAPWLTLSASAFAQLLRVAVRSNPFKPWPARLLLNLVRIATLVLVLALLALFAVECEGFLSFFFLSSWRELQSLVRSSC
jgi:hypothetical protein